MEQKFDKQINHCNRLFDKHNFEKLIIHRRNISTLLTNLSKFYTTRYIRNYSIYINALLII